MWWNQRPEIAYLQIVNTPFSLTQTSRALTSASSLCVVVLMPCWDCVEEVWQRVLYGRTGPVWPVFFVVGHFWICFAVCSCSSNTRFWLALNSHCAAILSVRGQWLDSATGQTWLDVNSLCFLGSPFRTTSQERHGRVAPRTFCTATKCGVYHVIFWGPALSTKKSSPFCALPTDTLLPQQGTTSSPVGGSTALS